MDAPLHDQIRYLELRLGECMARPALHRHQIAAYQRQLALARSVTSAIEYLRAIEHTRSAMDIPRAEWLDRYWSWSCAYRALGDMAKHRAALLNVRAAEAATGPADFLARITAAKLESAPIHTAADAAAGIIATLLPLLLDWVVEAAPAVKAELRATVEAFWSLLRQSDPGCTWKRVCEHPPYRHRIPFDDARMDMIGSWLREAVGPELCDNPGRRPATERKAEIAAVAPALTTHASAPSSSVAEQEPRDPDDTRQRPAPELPTPAQAALAYHHIHAALPADDPAIADTRRLYEHIFALEAQSSTGAELLRHMAEHDMYNRLARAPQLALARRALAHCRGTSLPHMEHHYQTLIATLEHSRSPTEVELEVERQGECFAVETAWNTIFLRYATRTIMAAIACQTDPSDTQRQTVAACHRLVSWLFGTGWDDMLHTPRIQDFLAHALFPASRDLMPIEPASPGALLGEIGATAAASMREATIALAIEQLQANPPPNMTDPVAELARNPVFATPEDLRDHITALFRQAMDGDTDAPLGPASHRELVLWGRRVHLHDLMSALKSPPRPEVSLEP